MPPFLAPLAILVMFAREAALLFKKPKYRSMIIWVGMLLLIGTVFYRNAEGWGWVDSLYFSVVTLATVGFGDLVPTTQISKLFTIFYILLGLGIIATFASMLANERLEMNSARAKKRAEDEQGG